MVLNGEIEAAEMGRCLGFGGFEHAVALSCSEEVGATAPSCASSLTWPKWRHFAGRFHSGPAEVQHGPDWTLVTGVPDGPRAHVAYVLYILAR